VARSSWHPEHNILSAHAGTTWMPNRPSTKATGKKHIYEIEEKNSPITLQNKNTLKGVISKPQPT